MVEALMPRVWEEGRMAHGPLALCVHVLAPCSSAVPRLGLKNAVPNQMWIKAAPSVRSLCTFLPGRALGLERPTLHTEPPGPASSTLFSAV